MRCTRLLIFSMICTGVSTVQAADPKVVDNSARGLWDDEPRKTFRLLEELYLGGDDGENDVVFGRIADIAVDSRGRIIVLDGGFSRVTVYDPDSMSVRTFGRKGEGPGELVNPTAIGVDSGDRIYVASQGGRIAVFQPNGEWIDEFRHKLHGGGFIYDLRPFARDLYFACYDPVDFKVVHRYDANHGLYLSSFSDAWSMVKATPPGELWAQGGAIDVDANGFVYYTQYTPYEIRKFSPEGELLLTIHRENDFKPPRIVREGDSVSYYNYSGSFAIVVLPDGMMVNVVARVSDDHKISGTVVDVFDADGRFLKSTELDRLVSISCRDSDGRLYASESREVPQVVRYRLGFK